MSISIERIHVQKFCDEGMQLVEVLPAHEYEDEHLPGARNIPLTHLTRQTTAALQRNQPLIVYCYDYQ